MHELKTRLYQYADKFATFWMFPKRFQHSSIRFANYPYTFYNQLNPGRKVYPLLAKRK